MKKDRLYSPLGILFAVVTALFIISISVVITLNFRPLYYMDIGALDIPALSGLPEAEIRQNYDALIDYNALFYRGALRFPTLPMSETGRIHFEEVKVIFDAVQVLALVSGVMAAICAVVALRRGRYRWLGLAAGLSVGIPAVLGLLVALNWSRFFIMFHKLFFRNDYWVFSVETDPVISILPDTFFLHCAVMILGLIVLGGLLCLLARVMAGKKAAARQ